MIGGASRPVKMERQMENLTADICVVGGGMAGMTTALEAAETGREVVIIEKAPYLGGRVASLFHYFPKLCPPSCGLEINFRRIRQNPRIRFFTLADVEALSGGDGNYTVKVVQSPRFVNEKCTGCGECDKTCELERSNGFNYDLDKTKAIYMPYPMAFPFRRLVDPAAAADPKMKACAEACPTGAIDLDMKAETFEVKAGALVWATGWKPYDATRLDNLGYGRYGNVVTNVIFERLAAPDGPTEGKIQRISDEQAPKTVAFVQCAGSRDENHLPYCSAVCCSASIKQARYVRDSLPDSEVHIFYIDVRTPGRLEDFYVESQGDGKIVFHRGKVAKVTEKSESKNLVVEAENTLTGEKTEMEVDMVVLATGMVPNTVDVPPPGDAKRDDFGFLEESESGVIGAGVSVRPLDVAATVQDATGKALKAICAQARE